MEFSISFLKDAGEALDKIADALGKFGSLLKGAAVAGADAVQWNNTRRAKNSLIDLTIDGQQLIASQTAIYVPTFRDIIENPTEENWPKILKMIGDLKKNVVTFGDAIKAGSKEIATQDFFQHLLLSVTSREVILDKLSTMKAPKTDVEVQALKAFLARYEASVAQLQEAIKELNQFIDRMNTDVVKGMRGPRADDSQNV